MKILGKSAARPRRSTRMWVLRVRKFGLILTGLSLCIGAYISLHNVSGQIAAWALQRTLTLTAAAGFRVNDILVTGRNQISQEDLLAKLGISQDTPVFSISIDDTQRNLQQIPWVKSVTVSRRLPDKIIVEIVERKPAALWQYQKKLSLIDAEGRSLTSKNLEVWEKLPLLVGEDAPFHVTELTALLQAEPAISGLLSSAVRVGGRRWDLHLENGTVVRLPEEDTEPALRALALAGENEGLFTKAVSVIDLRVPGKMAVTPRAIETTKTKTNI